MLQDFHGYFSSLKNYKKYYYVNLLTYVLAYVLVYVHTCIIHNWQLVDACFQFL